ncbi:unnamed protein product [Protopolystoma xenopodis]|uniref:Splicing factor cactin central domain-containing protein n=1 Tax=Protopolystoma xenopodis TaxID=117903 RepID=A0A3S5CMQ6_9PLAT|nr:unnamed protein product [Protopolystoma xenopodis]
MRSRIRIADGRAKPIDLLSKYISDQDEEASDIATTDIASAIDILEPTQFLLGLTVEDLEDLLEDIKIVYMELEKGRNADYWRDITIVAEDELRKLRQASGLSSSNRSDGRTSATISQAVLQSVSQALKGKSYNQLAALERQIQPKLLGGEGVDVSYWETLSQYVRAQMARTRLRELHQYNLRRKLECLRQAQGVLSRPIFPSGNLDISLVADLASGANVEVDPGDTYNQDSKDKASLPLTTDQGGGQSEFSHFPLKNGD